MARRIAAILLLEPALNANYESVKQHTFPCPQVLDPFVVMDVSKLFLDRDRNHVVICFLIVRHQADHSAALSYFCVPRSEFRPDPRSVSNPFRIRTSMTPLLQVLYNPHLQAPLGSAGNKGLITPLESALAKNSPVTSLESALTKTPGVPLPETISSTGTATPLSLVQSAEGCPPPRDPKPQPPPSGRVRGTILPPHPILACSCRTGGCHE